MISDLELEQTLRIAVDFHRGGKVAEAELLYQRILKDRPDEPHTLNLLGTLELHRGRLDRAEELVGRAVACKGRDPLILCNYGLVLAHKQRYDEAILSYELALGIEPNHAQAHFNLGSVYLRQKLWDKAISHLQRATELHPSLADAHLNLGIALQNKRHMDDAIEEFQRAIALQPKNQLALCNLGNALKDTGRMKEAMVMYRRAVDLPTPNAEVHSVVAMSINFDPDSDPQAILAENRRWNERYALPLRWEVSGHDNDPSPDRRLRVGYVSPDFQVHCQSHFTLPVLANHDHQAFEVFCYSSVRVEDDITRMLRPHADEWREVWKLNDNQLAKKIREDKIDVLIDLTMHMNNNRMRTMARKPAPVMITWPAYPGTTGLDAMDYRLTDPYLDPPGENDADYAEESIRLPETFWCYDPIAPSPPPQPGPLPALKNGFVTFGCLNNYCKVTPAMLDIWAGVLRSLSDSRLLVLVPEGQSRRSVLERLSHQNVKGDRIDFVDYRPRNQYLQWYQRVDVALDTLPYNGHTTSLDSFWMGVPVVTLVGRTICGRAGWSQLSNLNLAELAATTPEEFVEIALKLASDRQRLSELRAGLRQRMEKSPLMDAKRFTRNMESIYRQVWHRWCGCGTYEDHTS